MLAYKNFDISNSHNECKAIFFNQLDVCWQKLKVICTSPADALAPAPQTGPGHPSADVCRTRAEPEQNRADNTDNMQFSVY